MIKYSILQGDSTPIIKFGVKGYTSLAGFTANLYIKKAIDKTEVPIIEKVLVETNGQFLGYLTPSETESLAVGSYYMIFEIDNPTLNPPFRKEVHRKIDINRQGA